jgi:hypothetical protein
MRLKQVKQHPGQRHQRKGADAARNLGLVAFVDLLEGEAVAAKLKSESQRIGRPFREIVNETLPRGLESRRATAQRRAFRVAARDLGKRKPGLSLKNRGAHRACGGLASPVTLVDANLLLYAYPRERSSTSKAAAGSKLCSRGPTSLASLGLPSRLSSRSRQTLSRRAADERENRQGAHNDGPGNGVANFGIWTVGPTLIRP